MIFLMMDQIKRLEEFIISNINTNENKITVKIVDDIMGSGKTTWAIDYINSNIDKRFLCILPTLSECERYKQTFPESQVGESRHSMF